MAEWSEVQRVLVYCDRLRKVLRLQHWRVGVTVADADEDNHAQVDTQRGKFMAAISLNPDWADYSLETKKDVLLHEMLHLHLSQTQWAIADLVEKQPDLSKMRQQQITATLNTNLEYAVHALEMVLHPLLPAWPSARDVARANPQNGEHSD